MTLARAQYAGLYIDGAWVAPSSGETVDVINPATEQVIAQAPLGGVKEAGDAIAAARTAFDDGPWPWMTGAQRSAAIGRLRDVLTEWSADIASLVVAEVGTSRMTAGPSQVATPMRHLDYFVELARGFEPVSALPPTQFPNRNGVGGILGGGVRVREPRGVVTAITPFNAPFFLNILKIGPALAAGCTMILKPSDFTPLEALVIAAAAELAELPPGVLNVVTGGADVGVLLTTDPRVDMVSFTGSDAVGSVILAQAAPTMKRVLLELGGKSAMIVRADGDLDQAAATGASNLTLFAGQGCALLTRHLVHESVYDAYVDKLVANMARVTVGDPEDPTTVMGPLIRERQRARVESYVAGAVADGASVAVGGARPAGLERGYFYSPTVLTDVDNRMTVAQEEIFGPVGVVIRFRDDADAISIANDSQYGLSGSIWSGDASVAYDIARRLRTGNVSINGGTGGMSSAAPFGGYKRSGLGRELGVDALEEYTEVKAIQYRVR